MTDPRFRGAYTALVTPFRHGKVDEQAFCDLVEWQIEEGIHGLVPCGTTGESPTLSYEEHERVIALCVEAAAGRVPVMAGTGANATSEAVAFTRHARKVGADAALVVAPYYNKPTTEGLYQHFKSIHDATDIPMFIYNIPGRTGINMSDDLLAQLGELPNIIGVKDATGDLARVCTLRHRAGPDFLQFSGEDMTAVGFNVQGGIGVISVTANIAPAQVAAVQNASLAGDHARALALHDALVPLHQVMFCETNPGPVKFAVSQLDRCLPDMRLPMVPPTADHQLRIVSAMRDCGLL